jgi:3-hydroxymyristoyl/3-hydroxydecanoyl-(acyl carrier protein) dehydratase
VDAERAAALVRTGKKRPLWTPGPLTHEVSLGREAIERLLPHRDPFLFVDRITAIDLRVPAISGRRRIDPRDPIFAGHFPGAPLYPGVLQLETMGQLGICLAHLVTKGTHEVAPDLAPAAVRALKIHGAIFVAEVLPADELTILASLIESDAYGAVCAGQILKGDGVASFAVMEVYLVEG